MQHKKINTKKRFEKRRGVPSSPYRLRRDNLRRKKRTDPAKGLFPLLNYLPIWGTEPKSFKYPTTDLRVGKFSSSDNILAGIYHIPSALHLEYELFTVGIYGFISGKNPDLFSAGHQNKQ